MQSLIQNIKQTLTELNNVVQLMNNEQFSKPLTLFSGSSVGMHARHILEFYNCLLAQNADCQVINYDLRQRDIALQSCTTYFNATINDILNGLNNIRESTLNHPLSIMSDGGEASSSPLVSSLARELQYNLEHTIHHAAFIKIGVLTLMPDAHLPKTFGVAPSTLHYQNKE
jgi:hypothetical protein